MWIKFECILHNACAFKKNWEYSSVYVCFFYLFPPVHRYVNLIYYQWLHHIMHSLVFLKNNCHRQIHVVCTVLKYINRQYSCIHKHHNQFSWGFPGDLFSLFWCWIQVQWSLQMIHIHIFQLFYFCALHPSR